MDPKEWHKELENPKSIILDCRYEVHTQFYCILFYSMPYPQQILRNTQLLNHIAF